MDLTILIPTKNRHFHIKRILKYYSDFSFNGFIIFFDSSKKSIYKKNLKEIKKSKNHKISIVRYSALPFQCFSKFNHLIKTKYVCYSGDDDYFVISGLQESIKLLRKKKIIGINGNSMSVETTGLNYNSINSIGDYENYSSVSKNAFNRVKFMLDKYRVPLFSVFKSKEFKKMLRNVPNKKNIQKCPWRGVSDELIESFNLTYLGSISHFNKPFMLRTASNLERGYLKLLPYIKYVKSYEYLKKNIIKKFKNKKEKNILNFKFEEYFKYRNTLTFSRKTSLIVKLKFHPVTLVYTYFKMFFLNRSRKKFKEFYKIIIWLKKN